MSLILKKRYDILKHINNDYYTKYLYNGRAITQKFYKIASGQSLCRGRQKIEIED